MHSDFVLEAVVLNAPLFLCVALAVWLRIYPRLRVAILLGVLWQVASLPWLNLMGQHLGWWEFSTSLTSFVGLPLSFYIGWILWWGVVVVTAMGKLPFRGAVWAVAAAVLIFDTVFMPMLEPVLKLGENWLLGEVVLLVFGLGPTLWLAHVTLLDRRVTGRALLIAFAFAVVLLTVLPLAGGRDLENVGGFVRGRYWLANGVLVALDILLCVPGVAAVLEFSRVGRGTPIPFDPPRRFVTSGIYAYCANPMQLSITLVLLVWAWLIGSWLCIGIAAVSVVYSEGIAAWSERSDLRRRFGDDWVAYQRAVPRWRFRLLPHHGKDLPPARLFVDLKCGPCTEIADWFSGQRTTGMVVVDAQEWVGAPLRRITYLSPDGETSAEGVAAVACALQHVHLGWAAMGWLMKVPGIARVAQLAMNTTLSPDDRAMEAKPE